MSAGTAPTNLPSAAPPLKAPPPAAAFGLRIVIGLFGVLIAVLVAGINEHVTEIAMTDVRGAMFIGYDDGSWLNALYEASSVVAMAFAPWCSGTFTIRRFTIGATLALAALAFLMPFAPNLTCLYALRALQGLAAGSLPPMLMTCALRFLPPNIKLYGLGAYALTSTFAPNLGLPLAALWTEYVDWRFSFWEIIPFALLSVSMVHHGIPQDPLKLERLKQFNWRGVILGTFSIGSLVIGLEQGTRLGWLDSPLICWLFGGGGLLLVLFMINEWFHPLPFFSIRLLQRRNLSFALIVLAGVLLILVAVPSVPAVYLAEIHQMRPLQSVPLALLVALPQLLALPAVAALCNLRFIDCRWVLAAGLGCIAASCFGTHFITADWSRDNFLVWQALQIVGQPMAVIPLLMLATNGMTPAEGPFASSWFNSIKGFAGVLGAGVFEGVMNLREHFHSNRLVDQLASRPQVLGLASDDMSARLGFSPDQIASALDQRIRDQAIVLAASDVMLLMTVLSLALMLLILFMPTRVYPPRAVASPPVR